MFSLSRARRLYAGFFAALLVLSCAGGAEAQSPTGSLEGVVVDRSGGVLTEVAVTLLESGTGAARAIATDGSGRFRAPLLPVGVYELTLALPRFQTLRQTDIRVTVGHTVVLRLEMALAGITQTVTVSSATPVIETGRSQVSSTVNEIAVRNLPVNGRNFIDFVLLTPGVTRDVRTGDLSFAGQRGTLNSLVVDGADNNNTFGGQTLGRTGSGRAPYQFSQDAVKEFQVNSNAFSAEYGRAGGGVINVVTRSGTNELHGSVAEFYRDKALNARDAITARDNRPKLPYHYHQFGGTLGGPLRPNRDFFFFNYDGQRNTQANGVSLNLPAIVPGDAATLAGLERLRPLAFTWNRRLDQDVFLARSDHQLGARHRVTLRYNHQNFTGVGYETTGPQNAFEHAGDSLVKTRTMNVLWSGVVRSSLFNEVRVQYARDHEPGTANSDKPEAQVQQGGVNVLFIGRNSFSPRDNRIDRVQAADTLTWFRGTHTLKTGFDFQFDRIRNYFPGFFSGGYLFRSLASFASGRPESYQQSFPGPGTSGAETRPDIQEYSLFVQDEWRLARAVTVNLGLRYDLMKIDAPRTRNPDAQLAAADIDTSRFEPDTNNVGPRLGVAWSRPGSRYVVRGGWGMFFARTPAILASAAASNGINVVSLTFTGDAVPVYPNKFAEIPATGSPARPNIFFIAKDFANSRLMQANAAVEWELARDTSLTLTYMFVDGDRLTRSIDRNIGAPGTRTYTIAESGAAVSYPFFASDRPFSAFTRVMAFESTAESRYHGLSADLHRRFARGMQFRIAYTLGKVVDTVPDATAVTPGAGDDGKFASNPIDFDSDRAVGNNDQRHRLVASAVYSSAGAAGALRGKLRTLTAGWWLSAIFTAQSGQPYSARVGGVDLNNDGNRFNDRAPGTHRNAFRLPAVVAFDPRVARDVPLRGRVRAQLTWEAFNLFNRDNVRAVVPVYYTVSGTTLSRNASFGQPPNAPSGERTERIMQLAAKITF